MGERGKRKGEVEKGAGKRGKRRIQKIMKGSANLRRNLHTTVVSMVSASIAT